MAPRQPGFGLPTPWRIYGAVGIVHVANGGITLLIGQSFGFVIVLCGLVMFLIASIKYRAIHEEARRLRTEPPIPCAELTALILTALGATAADLAANAAAILPPLQWMHIQDRIGLRERLGAPLPAIQSVTGCLSLGHVHTRNGSWYQLTSQGIVFKEQRRSVVMAIKRTASYRVYFIDTLIPGWFGSAEPVRVILSAEALSNG